MANFLLTQTGAEVQDILNQAPETEAGLQQEVTNREQAITDEEQAREQAIAAEATARQQAVAAEATARADADAALDAKIDAETTRAEGAEQTLTDAIAQEVTDRTAAVAAEATARQQALAQETSRAQQAELANAQAISTNAQALQAEARTRQSADTDLQDHIDDEETRAKAAEATLQSNIDALGQSGGAAVAAERERAQAAEGTLDGKIDAETDRAEAAEGTLTAAIAQEVTDRTTAVAAEATARADADAALQTAINGKQATIADLADIRSGAAAGATAYQKPQTGIPATDMSAEVQTSLGKADTALQEHQSLADYATKQEVTDAVSVKANASDVYTKTETYSKTEVNELITTPNQQYVSVTATAQTTAVTDLLPATGAADTIYRVGNWDGTQYNDSVYSEYAWDGTAYIKLCTKSQIGDVYDISANHADAKYADLAAALGVNGANIPQSLRKGGMSVKFVQSSDNKYVQWRLTSTSFSVNTADWVAENEDFRNEVMQEVGRAVESITPIEIIGDVTNAPDEEDLTSVNVGGTDVLKFKDKAYTPFTYSGMGRVYLRKNMVDGVNVLTQEMFKLEDGTTDRTDTIYVIQYDFTLGEDITVPANCVLKFDGGSLSNGSLIGNNTHLTRGKFSEITFTGTWNADTLYDTDFTYNNDNDLFNALSALSSNSVFNDIYIQGNYDIDILSDNYTVFSICSYTKIHLTGTVTVNGNRFPHYRIFGAENKTNVTIDGGGSIIGDTLLHDYTTISSSHEWGELIFLAGCENCLVENINCSYATGDGISIDSSSVDKKSKNCVIRYCTATYCRRFGITIFGAKDILISNCEVSNTNDYDSSYNVPACLSSGAIDLEAWRENELTENITIEDCYFHDNKSFSDDLIISRRGYDIRVIRTKGNIRIQPQTDNAPIYIDSCTCININCLQGNITITNSKIGTIFTQRDLNNKSLTLNIISSEMNAALGGVYLTSLDASYPSLLQNFDAGDRDIKVRFDGCKFIGGETYISYTRSALSDSVSFIICNSTIETTNEIIVGMVDYIDCIIKCRRLNFIISKKCVELNQCTIIFSDDANSSSNSLFFLKAVPIKSNAEGTVIVKMYRNLFRNISNKTIFYILATDNNATATTNFSNRIIYFEDNVIGISNNVGRENYIKHQFSSRTGIVAYFGIDGRNVLQSFGTTDQRPKGPMADGIYADKLCVEDKGFSFFDSDIDRIIFAKTISANDTNVGWVEADGAPAGIKRVGTFAEKPTTGVYVGFRYFCTDRQTTEGATDGIEIIHKGNNVWVDALGRVVS